MPRRRHHQVRSSVRPHHGRRSRRTSRVMSSWASGSSVGSSVTSSPDRGNSSANIAFGFSAGGSSSSSVGGARRPGADGASDGRRPPAPRRAGSADAGPDARPRPVWGAHRAAAEPRRAAPRPDSGLYLTTPEAPCSGRLPCVRPRWGNATGPPRVSQRPTRGNDPGCFGGIQSGLDSRARPPPRLSRCWPDLAVCGCKPW